MDLKAKKLRIIDRILRNDNPEILDAIESLLARSGKPDPDSLIMGAVPAGKNTDPEVRELQDSIDAVFQANPNPNQQKDALP